MPAMMTITLKYKSVSKKEIEALIVALLNRIIRNSAPSTDFIKKHMMLTMVEIEAMAP